MLATVFRLTCADWPLIAAPQTWETQTAAGFVAVRNEAISGVELSAGVRVIDYRFTYDSILRDDEANVGPVYVSALRSTRSSWFGRPVAVGHALRFELPLTSSETDATVVAAAPSFHVRMPLGPSIAVHGRAIALLWAALPDAGPDTRAALGLGSQAVAAVTDWLAVSAGLDLQGGWYGRGLDHLAGRAGLRVQAGRGHVVEAATLAPLVGEEVHDLAFVLGVSLSL